MILGVSKPDSGEPIKLKGRGDSSSWLKEFPVSEWDLHALLGLRAASRRVIKKALAEASHQIVLSMPLPENMLNMEAMERVTVASEILMELGGLALLVRPSQRVIAERELFIRCREELAASLELWVDPGQVFPKASDRLTLPQTHWVADPLWHPSSNWRMSRIHKLHGWHEVRWIRHYGELQLQQALKRSRRARVLLLGHSKREEEAARLSALLRSALKR